MSIFIIIHNPIAATKTKIHNTQAPLKVINDINRTTRHPAARAKFERRLRKGKARSSPPGAAVTPRPPRPATGSPLAFVASPFVGVEATSRRRDPPVPYGVEQACQNLFE
ncbi:hypothetical protein EVAR_40721_1 [Eumeta japonica]|uniref:Uncharacterized protein n=1 Tax=Eumeta variegata TaxID=151549 RepID=A0A4C1XAC5_EUMVA|nr:hypothetical protein EVAR_40721_1 [Eumeta japonica]